LGNWKIRQQEMRGKEKRQQTINVRNSGNGKQQEIMAMENSNWKTGKNLKIRHADHTAVSCAIWVSQKTTDYHRLASSHVPEPGNYQLPQLSQTKF